MVTKTLEYLRALAQSHSIKGYAQLTRKELERQLAKIIKQKPHAVKKKSRSRSQSKSTKPVVKTARSGGKKGARILTARPAARTPKRAAVTDESLAKTPYLIFSNDEERVEDAKYASVLPGSTAPQTFTADLNEDINNLPPITEPMLCLLPQKPGVLHGYWIIPPDSVAPRQALKLRLGRIAAKTLEVIAEIPLNETRGHWYFHLDESTDMDEVYLQLGYYEANGNFVSAIRRGIARIPTLHASEQTDRLWWVSAEQFRAMYLRAGGFARGVKLGWTASISSPSGASNASSEQLSRPGKQSSR